MDLPLHYRSDIRTPAAARDPFRIGIDDAIILPMVAIAFLTSTLFQIAFFFLAFASTVVSALVRWMLTGLLLVAATAGDAIAWSIKRLATHLPQLSGARRKAICDLVDRGWPRLRQRLRQEVVANTTQSVLQRGSTWVSQSFGALSPRAALLVIVAVTVWLPLSALISIAMHAVLFANAAWLPAWTQLLHPVATLIAKSKLLVLAAYPAAWPQAKKHVLAQAALRCADCLAAGGRVRKTAQRYQQTQQVFAQASDAGLRAMLKCINALNN
jgi:hypothetical protein